MIIIFEGHDRCGKTTIANKLAERFNTQVFMSNSRECFTNSGAPSSLMNLSKFNYMVAKFAKEVQSNIKKPIIIYRSFLSELVYSNLFNRETNFYYNISTDQILDHANAVIILCKNNSKEVFNDETTSDELIKKSIELFDEYKEYCITRVIELDTSQHKVDEYINYLVEKLNLE
jgi:thymidylate kinase